MGIVCFSNHRVKSFYQRMIVSLGESNFLRMEEGKFGEEDNDCYFDFDFGYYYDYYYYFA